MVLKDGYRPEHFVPGPLARAMRAGGILYVEELNRAPSGALNALLTALSDALRRGAAARPRRRARRASPSSAPRTRSTTSAPRGCRAGSPTASSCSSSTTSRATRSSRSSAAAAGPARAGLARRSPSTSRASRASTPTCATARRCAARSTSSTCSRATTLDELDLDTLRFLALQRVRRQAAREADAPAGRRARSSTSSSTRCSRRDYDGSVEALLEHAAAAPVGDPAESDAPAPAGATTRPRPAVRHRRPAARRADDRRSPTTRSPASSRPGGGEAGESRSVPMVDRDQPVRRAARGTGELHDVRETHLRDPEAVMRARARARPARSAQGVPARAGRVRPAAARAALDRGRARAARRSTPRRRVRRRRRHAAARRLPLLEPRAAPARLRDPRRPLGLDGRPQARGWRRRWPPRSRSSPPRAARDYAVLAFDDELKEIKPLGRGRDVEDVVELDPAPARGPRDRPRQGAAGRRRARRTRLPERDRRDPHQRLHADPRGRRRSPRSHGSRRGCRRSSSASRRRRSPAIRMFHGGRQIDLYEWWARQWVGDDRLAAVRGSRRHPPAGRPLVDRHATARPVRPTPEGAMNKIPIHLDVNGVPYDAAGRPGPLARRRAA